MIEINGQTTTKVKYPNIEENAYDFVGEVGGDWDACDWREPQELAELSDKLTEAVTEWLEKYGYSPNLYAVENIKKYDLKPKQ